jgi:hypothetical protein
MHRMSATKKPNLFVGSVVTALGNEKIREFRGEVISAFFY